MIMTETTCSEACWEAREDVCRCMCGGENHGIHRHGEFDEQQPERTARIDGWRYKLVDKGEYWEMSKQARDINHANVGQPNKLGYTYYPRATDKGAPARVKMASMSQVNKWPELEWYKAVIEQSGDWARPYLLWERVD